MKINSIITHFPAELKSKKQFITWNRELNSKGKLAKVPQPTFKNPASRMTLEKALDRAKGIGASGIGVIFTDDLIGIDLDDAFDEIYGDPLPLAKDIVEMFQGRAYIEKSVSGQGIHIIARGKKPDGAKCEEEGVAGIEPRSMEAYDATGLRYFTISGDVMEGSIPADEPLPDCTTEIAEACRLMRLIELDKPVLDFTRTEKPTGNGLSAEEVLSRCRNDGIRGLKFTQIFDEGDQACVDYDASRADAVVAEALLFWSGGNFQLVEDVMLGSNLFREKFTEPRGETTYLAWTITKLASMKTRFYSPNLYSLSETGNATRFADKFKDEVCFDGACWRIYASGVWDGENAEVRLIGPQFYGSLVRDMLDDAKTLGDDGRKALLRWVTRSESLGVTNATINLARGRMLTNGTFDAHPHLLNVANGTINLKTGELYRHRSNDMLTAKLNVAYKSEATAPRWLQFLSEIFCNDADLIAFVQRAVGYSLSGEVRENALFILHNGGRNGKTTFLETIFKLLAPYATTLPNDILTTRSGTFEGAGYELATLEGKRFATTTELEAGSRLRSANVKKLTGGDTLSVRQIYGRPKNIKNVAKLWMATNHRPTIPDEDLGIWRRIKLVPFNRTFEEDEIDLDLGKKLENELEGILAWAVAGAVAYYTHGLGTAEAVSSATKEYREEENPFNRFLTEACDKGINKEIPKSELADAFLRWCRHNNFPEISKIKFNRQLKDLGYTNKTVNGSDYWVGVDVVW